MLKEGFITLSFISLLALSADSRPVNRSAIQPHLSENPISNQKVLTAKDFRADNQIDRGTGREEVSFLIKINPKLPPYRFRLIPDQFALANCDDPRDSDRCGQEHPRVGRIEISTDGASDVLQTIDVESNAWASMFTKHFKALDINFDGYLDIATLDGFGAKWSGFNYWLFDKRSGRFITNALTRELRELSFNEIVLRPKTKEIYTTHLPSVCFGKKIHKIVNGRLVLMYSEEPMLKGEGDDFCKLIIEKRINGKMRRIRTSNK